ncbi:MAG: response regulator [Pirellulales bacterium]
MISANPIRILIVDDDPDTTEILAMLLRGPGREVQVCHSGTECLELVGSFPPHLVLLDLRMPGIDGWETARRLRRQHPSAMLIAITALSAEDDQRRSKEAGFFDHMVKPLRLDKLFPLLNRMAVAQ